MLSDNIYFIGIAFIPLLLYIILHANSAAVFMSMCAGFVLLGSVDQKIIYKGASAIPSGDSAILKALIIFVPIIIVSLLVRVKHNLASKFINIAIALLSGCVLAITIPSITGLKALQPVLSSQAYISVQKYDTPIIASAILLSILSLAFGTSNSHQRNKKSKH